MSRYAMCVYISKEELEFEREISIFVGFWNFGGV